MASNTLITMVNDEGHRCVCNESQVDGLKSRGYRPQGQVIEGTGEIKKDPALTNMDGLAKMNVGVSGTAELTVEGGPDTGDTPTETPDDDDDDLESPE